MRLAAKWRHELTDAVRKASSIAIALSYEQVFEGIDEYTTAIWMGDDEDCMKEIKLSTAVRAFCFLGCCVIAAIGWNLTEYLNRNVFVRAAKDHADEALLRSRSPARVPSEVKTEK